MAKGRRSSRLARPGSVAAEAARAPGALVWATAGLTGIASLLERLWFARAWNEVAAPATIFYEGDARVFLDHAAQLLHGIPINDGIPFHPPGWPMVLSVFFGALGFDPLAGQPANLADVKVFVASISALAVAVTTVLAWYVAGEGAMLAVALVGTFHFGHMVQGNAANSEALYGLLLAVHLLLVLRWADRLPGARPRAVRWGGLWLGAVGGFATLVRAEYALCALLLAAALGLAGKAPSAARRRLVAAYLAGFFLALAPTTVSHWRSISAFNAAHADTLPAPLPRLAPVTSYGAFNFAHAFHDGATGGTNLDLLVQTPKDPTEAALVAQGKLDITQPVSYDLYVNGYRKGLEWIGAHPVDAAALLWRKAVITAGVFSLGYLHDDVGAGIAGVRRRVDQLDPEERWLWPVHVVLVLLGLWIVGRRRLVLAAPLVTLAASTLLFFGYVRLGAAYLPVFWVLQGAALAWLMSRVPWPAVVRGRSRLLVLALGLALLVAEGSGADRVRRLSIEAPTGPDGRPIRDAAIRIWPAS